MESLKNPKQNDDETMNRAIEDEQLKIKDENKVIEYVMHFMNLSFIRYFIENIFQVKIKIS